MTASAIKTIAVHLPAASVTARLLSAAVPLAKAHDAALVGVHVVPAVVVYADATVSMSTEFIVAQQQAFHEDAGAIEQAFRGGLAESGIPHEWRYIDSGDDPTMRAAATICNTADLVVATQSHDSIPAAAGYSPDELVMGTGRPVLIIPTEGNLAPVGKRVLIGWNGSRECTRATYDTISLLQPDADVRLVSIDSSRGDSTMQAMAANLGRHGVRADAVSVTRKDGRSTPEEIMLAASEFGADMISLGCYGHSRLRETVFGGATTRMLRDMTLPLLMAH